MLIYILLLNLISICLKAAIAFVATAGAASNLALNVYQQNAIDNTNADLTTKQHQIAQILSKGKHDILPLVLRKSCVPKELVETTSKDAP